MSDLRLVVFDLDGTLVDSQAHILAAMQAAFETLSLTAPSRDAILGIVGLSLPQAFARLAPEVPQDSRDRLVTTYKQAFFDLRQSGDPAAASPLYPGAKAALETLAQRDDVLLGVATGKSRRGTVAVLETHGLTDYFVSRQVADDHPSKPHPSMILTALRETGTDAANAVVIGDTTYDMDMACAAGVAGLGVGWGYHTAEALRGAGARDVLTGFSALGGALEALWQKG